MNKSLATFFENYMDQNAEYRRLIKALLWLLMVSVLATIGAEAFIVRRPHATYNIGSFAIIFILLVWSYQTYQRGIYWPVKLVGPLATYGLITYVLILGNGLHDPALLGYGIVVLIVNVILGSKGKFYALLLAYISLAIVTIADISGVGAQPELAQLTNWGTFFIDAVLITLVSLVLNTLQTLLNQTFEEVEVALTTQQQANQELEDIKNHLEEQVQERTQSLEATLKELEAKNRAEQRRLQLYQGAANIARHIAAASQSQEDIYNEITHLVSSIFDYEHVGLFLSDQNQENLRLVAANSPGGKKLLAQHHHLRFGESLVGNAAMQSQLQIIRSTAEQAIPEDNICLPDTQAEAALPLVVGEEVVGVLDLQSQQANAFGDEEIIVLEILADEIAVAIATRKLFENLQKRLQELQLVYREQTRESWQKLPKRLRVYGYLHRPGKLERLTQPAPLALPAEDGAVAQSTPEEITITTPIKFRGETLAALQVKTSSRSAAEAEAYRETLQAIAERIALAIENARLYEETSRRAQREHIVARIIANLRGSNDPDEMLSAAMQELKQALSARDIRIIPKTSPNTPSAEAEV